MPKRNQRELANTRFYLDRNKDLFYEVFTDPKWDPTNDKMDVRRRSNHWERLFLAYKMAMEKAEHNRNEVLAKEKQFSDPDKLFAALARNEYAISMRRNSIHDANPHPEAMDEETVQELSAGFHSSSAIVPSHLQRSLPRSEEY